MKDDVQDITVCATERIHWKKVLSLHDEDSFIGMFWMVMTNSRSMSLLSKWQHIYDYGQKRQ